jgi:glycogen(starch) synthase
MLRVLHCIYDDPRNPWVGGGGAMRVFEIYRRLTGEVDATVLTGRFPGARDEVREGVRYLRRGAAAPYVWSRWTYARAATKLLSAAEYDAAVYDFSAYTPIRIPTTRPVGIVVHMLHGPTAADRWGRVLGAMAQRVERGLLHRARWVSTTSRWMLAQLEPLLAPGARVLLVGSGVPEEFASVQREERGFLLYYGRFDVFQKGLDTLVEAFAILQRDYPDLELYIAGRGKDEERVRELVRALGVEQRTRILPGVSREMVLDLFSGALALLMPSRLEGLPMVPAEAMVAGVPVVATSVGAIPEIVEPPHGGVLVPPDDPHALAEAAVSLLADPARREALSRSARHSAERFSWETIAHDHLCFLQAIAAQGSTGSSPSHSFT